MSPRDEEGSIGYILHRRPYRENSLILELFTREHGRMSLVARKRSGRKAASPIAYEAFRRLRLRWRGRGELKTLTGLEQAGSMTLSRDRLLFGVYLNELLLRLLPRGEEEAPLFDAYEQALRDLAGGADAWCTTMHFELELVQALGYGLDPEHLEQEFASGEGRIRQRVPALSDRTWRALERGDVREPGVAPELRELLDVLFYHYAGGRRLRARALLPSLYQRNNQ